MNGQALLPELIRDEIQGSINGISLHPSILLPSMDGMAPVRGMTIPTNGIHHHFNPTPVRLSA